MKNILIFISIASIITLSYYVTKKNNTVENYDDNYFYRKINWSTNEATRRTSENEKVIYETGGVKSEWYYSFLNDQDRVFDKKNGIPDNPYFSNTIPKLEKSMFEAGYFIATCGTQESNDIILIWLTKSEGYYPTFTKDIVENSLLNSSNKEVELFRIKVSYSYFKNSDVKKLVTKIIYNRQEIKSVN